MQRGIYRPRHQLRQGPRSFFKPLAVRSVTDRKHRTFVRRPAAALPLESPSPPLLQPPSRPCFLFSPRQPGQQKCFTPRNK